MLTNTKYYPPEYKKGKNSFEKFPKEQKKTSLILYFIYGMLAIVFVAVQFLNWGETTEKTDWRALKEMLMDGDVEKIILVNKETAEIYIKPDKLNQEKYKDVHKHQSFGQQTSHFYYNVADPATFMEDIQETQEGMSEQVYVELETRHNWGGEVLIWILPIALLIGVWFFFMRMMSRGGQVAKPIYKRKTEPKGNIGISDELTSVAESKENSGMASELKKLAELHKIGMLSEEEFAKAKRKIIEGDK